MDSISDRKRLDLGIAEGFSFFKYSLVPLVMCMYFKIDIDLRQRHFRKKGTYI